MEKRMVKRLAAAMLAATVAIGTPMAASATWRTEGKGWNWTVDGKNATGWQMIENTWYYFNSEGTMQTGWVPYGNSWYFLQPTGAMATGWVQDGGKDYYLKGDGSMATGWVQTGGTWYCMSSTGEMRTGWVASGDDWYYLAPTGAMVTDAVIKVDDAVYAIAADGSMQTGEVEIAGETYTFGADGAATGETIPEPDRSFSTAATPGGTPVETTPTTPPADGGSTTAPTTPTRPNRPSYIGGGDDNDSSSDDSSSSTPDTTPASLTVKVVEGEVSLLGKKPSDMGAYTVSGTAVSGTAKKITDYDQFNTAESGEREGYFVPLAFPLDGSKIGDSTVVTVNTGSKEFTFTNKKGIIEDSDTDLKDTYLDYFVNVFRLGGPDATTQSVAARTFKIEVDYDGDGTIDAKQDVTFTGVTVPADPNAGSSTTPSTPSSDEEEEELNGVNIDPQNISDSDTHEIADDAE